MQDKKLKQVTGRWRGSYSFDPSSYLSSRTPVPFTLTLKQGWFGGFTGTVIDDATDGMPDEGTVDGYFSFPRIEFMKRMPVCYIATRDGKTITLCDFLIQHGQICERDVPHPPIIYFGKFTDTRHASGTWIIREGLLQLPPRGAIQIPKSTGGWTIENVNTAGGK